MYAMEIEILTMALPETIVIYFLIDGLLGNKLKTKKLFKMSIITILIYYIIKKTFIHSLNLLAIIIPLIYIYHLFSKVRMKDCFIALSIVAGIKLFLEAFSILILNIYGITLELLSQHLYLKKCIFYITLAVSYLIYLYIKKKNINIINVNKKSNPAHDYTSELVTLFCIIDLIIIVVLLFNFGKYYNTEYDTSMLISVIVAGFVFFISLLLITLSIINKDRYIKQIENNLYYKNIKQMEDTVELLRVQKHDYANHLQVILMQLDKGNKEDIKKYILGISGDVGDKVCVFDTGNSYIDAILNFKYVKCTDNDILLTACVDTDLGDNHLSDTQTSAIILNIIDNAIDELTKHNNNYKYIHVDLFCENDTYNISIKNNGPKIPDIDKIFEKGFSSKGDERGYGLYSIQQMLESNKCRIEVLSDEEETEFTVYIPILSKA